MRAAILDGGRVHVGEFPDPSPIKGQVLVRTLRCALCASDAHFLTSGPTIVARSQKSKGPYAGVDLSKPIVMGHEYVGEILDYGPGSRRPLSIGTLVTAIPGLRTERGFRPRREHPSLRGRRRALDVRRPESRAALGSTGAGSSGADVAVVARDAVLWNRMPGSKL